MSDIDAVIDLLERWRDATGMGRLRIGMDATRVIAQLPPQRKRALAVEVAERVAPQLVPAIRAESGDLTAEQVGALVDLLRRADRDQLDDLVVALRTGDVGGAAGIVGEAADIVGDATDIVVGPDEETDALLEDIATEDEPETDVTESVDSPASTAAASTASTESPASTESLETDPPAESGASAEEGREATAVATGVSAAAAAAAAAERDHVEVNEDGSLELDEAAVRERLTREAAQRAQQYRDSSPEVPRAPAYRAPKVDFTTEYTDFEFPDTSVETVAPLHERIERPGAVASTAQRRLGAPPVSTTVASITATPDGYRRRRAAMEAIRTGRMEAEDVAPVVRSFERSTDRSWIAGAALDAGVIDAAALGELDLPQSARARLQRRAR